MPATLIHQNHQLLWPKVLPFSACFTVKHVDGVFGAADVDDLLSTGGTHLLGAITRQRLHFGSSGDIYGYPGVFFVSYKIFTKFHYSSISKSSNP